MKYELVDVDYQMMLGNLPAVAVDSKDNVYITIRAPFTPVVVFSPEGEFLRGMGTGMGIQNPHGIALDAEDNIYLVDTLRQVVHKIAQQDELLMTLGTLDQPAAESGAVNGDLKTVRRGGPPFNFPSKAAIARNGDIYVADGYGNARIHCFAPDGALRFSVGEPGTAPGQFRAIHGIAVDDEAGEVYAADRENLRIQVFDLEGNYKRMWNNIWRPADVCVRGDYVYVAELGEIYFTDNVYYDPRYHRHFSQVRVFDKRGRQQAQIGTADGGEPGSFMGAHGLSVDSRGDILVVELNGWDRHDIYTAWNHGGAMPTRKHPSYQRFRRVE